MIKPNKRKSIKKGSNLTSNIQPLISDHRGITLIALIITIIVMLILVAVSITIAINGGLFDTTKKAAKGTEEAKNAEQELASGRVKIDGVWYDSIEDYVGGNKSDNQTEPEKPVEPEKPEEPPVSYLGRTATIDGQKYIVLYDTGEHGEEIQLVSANVLEVDNVYLGKSDGQIDWTNASVIAEADILDNNGALDDTEKAVYSYNHAIETLNKKCENLVDMNNQDIVSVRSVGSNPINPSSENATLYTADLLKNYPNNAKGRYNGVGKSTDENYLTDYNRMQELGIIKAENGQNYWLASHLIYDDPNYIEFGIRYVDDNSICTYDYLWSVASNVNIAFCDSFCHGVRPVISLKSNAITKYLDE